MDKHWTRLYFDLCKRIAQESKDPSTKVGAFIVRPDNTPVSFGYNGFPRKVDDNDHLLRNRDEKYPRMVHAELNAILNSQSNVRDCKIFTYPLFPCPTCAGAIIQSGIREVVVMTTAEKWDWQKDLVEISKEMFRQSNIDWRSTQEGDC